MEEVIEFRIGNDHQVESEIDYLIKYQWIQWHHLQASFNLCLCMIIFEEVMIGRNGAGKLRAQIQKHYLFRS